jgi:hypothetical protein
MKRRRHIPEQIIRKLREADRLLAEEHQVPEVAKQLVHSNPVAAGSLNPFRAAGVQRERP